MLLINYTGAYSLVGHEYPRVGITKPRVGEIYDFEIGDRFIFGSSETASSSYWNNSHTERTVIGKTLYGTGFLFTTPTTTRQDLLNTLVLVIQFILIAEAIILLCINLS